jgi:putative toxin-antitoxin system antitoxin component (TIGR02293 family)
MSPLLLARVVPVIAHAVAVFGGEERATLWLTTPLEALEDRTPAELFSSLEGIDLVQRTLTRIELKIPL